jgi:hypothetical protein
LIAGFEGCASESTDTSKQRKIGNKKVADDLENGFIMPRLRRN